MARLTREDLFQIATAAGWVQGTPLTPQQRQQIKAALRNRLTQVDIAPTRVFDDTGASRPMTSQEAVDNLLEEIV